MEADSGRRSILTSAPLPVTRPAAQTLGVTLAVSPGPSRSPAHLEARGDRRTGDARKRRRDRQDVVPRGERAPV